MPMPVPLTIRGVPRALALDAWWLSADDPRLPWTDPSPGAEGAGGAAGPARVAALAALVALADLLFWHHRPGISLAVFAGAVLLAAGAEVRPRRALIRPALLLAAGAAPVAELVQPLSAAFLGAALLVALVLLRHPGAEAGRLPASALAFLLSLPRRCAAPLRMRGLRGVATGVRSGRWLRDWAFPLGGTLVLAALLMEANPVFARLASPDLDLQALLERGLFWAGAALILAPFLAPDLPLAEAPALPAPLRLSGLGINAGSVLRALVLFNLLLAAQMVTDASILLGGAALPARMDYAEYAHRGAYPLLATAILAGAFALAARPFLHEHRLIRPLLLLWLGQNVVLCGAAALRLELYIGAYGLTYLRVHALIWMALVAAGLGLIAWQALRDRDTHWLLLRVVALGAGTLYVCCFVNFAGIIAAQNLTRPMPDMAYVCDLGPMAAGAMRVAAPRQAWVGVMGAEGCGALAVPRADNWREWGFRGWRVARKVVAETTPRALP